MNRRLTSNLFYAVRRLSTGPRSINALRKVLSKRFGGSSAERETRWILQHITRQQDVASAASSQQHDNDGLIRTLSAAQLTLLHSMLTARSIGTPLQYVIGDVDFCGLKLSMKPPVLIARDDTAAIVQWLIHTIRTYEQQSNTTTEWPANVPFINASELLSSSTPINRPEMRILDVCSGSGNIAIALAAYTGSSVTGFDVNPAAIQLANKNRDNVESMIKQSYPHRDGHFQCEFIQQDIFALPAESLSSLPSLQHRYDIIVSNPPYVSETEYPTLPDDVRLFEDRHALIASDNGLQFYKHIILIAPHLLTSIADKSVNGRDGLPEIVFEIGSEEQCREVEQLLVVSGFDYVRSYNDYGGRKRWIAARRTE